MSYKYQEHRDRIFTEDGAGMLLQIRDNVSRLLKQSGAVMLNNAMRGVTGDTWLMMACFDYLKEKGEIAEVTDPKKVWGQHRIFIATEATS